MILIYLITGYAANADDISIIYTGKFNDNFSGINDDDGDDKKGTIIRYILLCNTYMK